LTSVAIEARHLAPILARYRVPNPIRSIFELVITAGPLIVLWVLMWITLDLGYWLCLLLAVPAAGFLVRLFMIQHDCGHGAFFHRRRTNDWVGRVLGVLTLTPYDFWRRTHAVHHSTSGNLDRRGMGDIDTLTVQEYLARSPLGRLRYRFYRHPLVMFGIGPAYLFIVQTPPAGRLDARGLAAMAQHHGDQRRNRGSRRHDDMADQLWGIPARASTDHASRRLDRGLAVLCPAPVRGHGLGS
jgi:fatty acid desaturase